MRNYSDLTDGMLLVRLKDSDERALREIYDRYWEKLLVTAVNRVNSLEAEDCLQEVFCSLWTRREELVISSTLDGYLAAALKYRIFKIYRSKSRLQARQVKFQRPYEEASIPSPDVYLIEKELIAKLEQTVQRLPEKCQLIYRMSREEGKSRKEIAEHHGITIKAVEKQLTRALRSIRTEINISAPTSSVIIAFFVELSDKLLQR
jgi:RNA polymerase sigma-70 factor (ECF subfamily)